MNRECYECGFVASKNASHCAKCDSPLREFPEDTILVVDIAHNGETVKEALDKLKKEIDKSPASSELLIIHGQGEIANSVLSHLEFLKSTRVIHNFTPENAGAVLIEI
ncbi:MAG: Smr/MutS family protein [Lentisphaeria bacterium]|nr:Smr/MutS family protein [Lentisphaeria bacterium]NQZ70784.1 Smr/MutS family protein [Lentisphaeria bacterium]